VNTIREDLKAFVDGELSPERMEEVRAAVEADPALQQEVAFMKAVGDEIRHMAAEPEVAGREALVSKFRKPLAPWWDPSRLSGRLAYTAGLFLVLAGVSAVLFPVFAQSKSAAKESVDSDALKSETLSDLSAGAASASPPPATEVPAEGGEERMRFQAPGSPQGLGGGRMSLTPDADAELEKSNEESGGFAAESKSPVPESLSGATAPSARKSSRPEPRVSNRDDKPSTTASAPESNRMVVKNASVDLKVENVEQAMTDAENLAKSLGGYTEGSNLTRTEGTIPRGHITLRVPSRSYESAMQSLRKFGEVLGQNSNAVDVTAAHADVQARLKVLRAEEESYVSMLRAARRVGEIMEIKDRLSQIRQQIESYDAQRKALMNEAALSTIHATFTEKAKVEEKKDEKDGGFDETWAKAQNGLANVGEFLGNLAIYIFVFSPVWLPPVILFWWLGRRAKA